MNVILTKPNSVLWAGRVGHDFDFKIKIMIIKIMILKITIKSIVSKVILFVIYAIHRINSHIFD